MYLALDVGGSSIKYALLDEQYHLVNKGTTPSRFSSPTDFAQGIRRIYDETGCQAQGVAISYCGELDPCDGYAYSGGSLPYNTGVRLRTLLQEHLPVPVSIENDGNCAAMAEMHSGCLKDVRNGATFILGTGIAAALMIDGKIYRGSHFSAGFASAIITDLRQHINHGENFSNFLCGINSTDYQPGNLLSMGIGYLGLTAPLAYAKGLGQQDLDGKAFFHMLEEGDQDADVILNNFCRILANFVFNIQCLLDVDVVAIGGGISQNSELIRRTQRELDNCYGILQRMGLITHPPRLCRCHHGTDANLIGALYHYLQKEEHK